MIWVVICSICMSRVIENWVIISCDDGVWTGGEAIAVWILDTISMLVFSVYGVIMLLIVSKIVSWNHFSPVFVFKLSVYQLATTFFDFIVNVSISFLISSSHDETVVVLEMFSLSHLFTSLLLFSGCNSWKSCLLCAS